MKLNEAHKFLFRQEAQPIARKPLGAALTDMKVSLADVAETIRNDDPEWIVMLAHFETLAFRAMDLITACNMELKASIDDSFNLMQAKNADYSGRTNHYKNFQMAGHLLGIDPTVAVMTRICDKISRIETIATCQTQIQVVTERLEDTCLDLINYVALLAGCWYECHANRSGVSESTPVLA